MHEFDARGSASLTYYHISLVFIEFEARFSGPSLEIKIFLIRKKQRKKGQSHIWRRASALPKYEGRKVLVRP